MTKIFVLGQNGFVAGKHVFSAHKIILSLDEFVLSMQKDWAYFVIYSVHVRRKSLLLRDVVSKKGETIKVDFA